VNALLDDYIEIINGMLLEASIIRFADEERAAGKSGMANRAIEARVALHEKHRPAELEKRREIANRVGEELRGTPPGD